MWALGEGEASSKLPLDILCLRAVPVLKIPMLGMVGVPLLPVLSAFWLAMSLVCMFVSWVREKAGNSRLSREYQQALFWDDFRHTGELTKMVQRDPMCPSPSFPPY